MSVSVSFDADIDGGSVNPDLVNSVLVNSVPVNPVPVNPVLVNPVLVNPKKREAWSPTNSYGPQ